MTDIIKGVPVPASKRQARTGKYKWADLEVGDMFIIDCSKQSAYTQAYAAGKKLGRKFVARETADGKVGVWRVADEVKAAEAPKAAEASAKAA